MGEVSVDGYMPDGDGQLRMKNGEKTYSDFVLQQLVENEAKLIILEYLSSSLPETEPIVIDDSLDFEGLDDTPDTVDQKTTRETNNEKEKAEFNNNGSLKSDNAVFVVNKSVETSRNSNKRLIQRSDSYMSYDDFVERREKIRQWHIRKNQRRLIQSKEGLREKRDYEKDEAFVPVKKTIQKYKNRTTKKDYAKSNLTIQTETTVDIDTNEDFLTNESGINKKRIPSEKFKTAKGKMEHFFGKGNESTKIAFSGGKEVPQTSVQQTSTDNKTASREEDEDEISCCACITPSDDSNELNRVESYHLSYEKFQARREKVRKMMIPVRKYIDSDLKTEIKNFDCKHLNPIVERRYTKDENSQSYQKFLEAHEKIKMLHGGHASKMARKTKMNKQDRSQIENEVDDANHEKVRKMFSPQKKKVNKYTKKKFLEEDEEEKEPSEDAMVSVIGHKVEEQEEAKRLVPEKSRLIIPPFSIEEPHSILTPETYAVNCLEAIAQDIMENNSELWYDAVHSLMCDGNLMKYDNFSSFATSLAKNKDGAAQNIFERIGMVLSVVKEAMIFGDLTDNEVEQMVDNSTKFVVESTLTDKSLHDVQSPESENNDMEIEEAYGVPTTPKETIKDKITSFKNTLHDWMPFMVAILTVSLALAYTSRKVEKS